MDRRKEEARDDSDGWVEDALQTDFMAANMLVRLSGSSRQPLKWLRRLPRSRQQQQPPSNAIAHVKEIRDSARASPSTPLSFSGSSSPSACDDPVRPAKRSRIDDSSSQSEKTHARAAPATTDTRSKMGRSKTVIEPKSRTKKKKTVAELKEEKDSLLMDNLKLIENLEALQATHKDLILKNEKLKKLKLKLESQSAAKASTSAASDPPPAVKAGTITTSDPRPVVKTTSIPDLNFAPPGDESPQLPILHFQ